MGLDAYFYRRTKVTDSDIVTDDLILNTFQVNGELRTKLNQLKAHAKARNKSLYECLSEAVTDYLNYNGYSNEILYFRNLYYLLDYFGYGDEWYAKDMTITKEQCIDLRDKAKVCLEDCERLYKEHGCYVISYLADSPLTVTRSSYERSSEYSSDINEIFNKYFPGSLKDITYDKVGRLYHGMNIILEETDWDKQEIIFNADW